MKSGRFLALPSGRSDDKNTVDFRYIGVPGTTQARVVYILTGRTEFEGTLTECRSYKRRNYNQFTRIYLVEVKE